MISLADGYSENNFHIDKQRLKTKISNIEPNKIVIRGYNQEDLIDNISYTDMCFLLLKGYMPSLKESKIFNHILVSFGDHGVTPPSTQTSRLIASSGSPLNNSLAGGLLSFGKNHAGAIEKSMDLFQNSINSVNLCGDNDIDNKLIAKLAIEVYGKYISSHKKIPGFGHRYHKKDPRGSKLIEIAIEEGMIGPHTKLAMSIEKLLMEKKGVCINVDGANGGLLSDLGFPPELGLGIFMIGRVPGLIAHSYEEMHNEDEFRKFFSLDDIDYIGRESKQL